MKRNYTVLALGIAAVIASILAPAWAESDRFEDYAAIAQRVPHERLRTWPVEDRIGLDLLVKPSITDKQIAELVKWYRSVGARIIFVYDSHVNAGKGECAIAMYSATSGPEDLVRYKYRKGELVGITSIDLSSSSSK